MWITLSASVNFFYQILWLDTKCVSLNKICYLKLPNARKCKFKWTRQMYLESVPNFVTFTDYNVFPAVWLSASYLCGLEVTCGVFVLMCTKRVLLQIFKDIKVKRKKIGDLQLFQFKGPQAKNSNGTGSEQQEWHSSTLRASINICPREKKELSCLTLRER